MRNIVPIPLVDTREKDALMAQMEDLARSYTPEWSCSSEAPDGGYALLRLTAGLFSQTVQQINGLYPYHRIQFSNLCGAHRMPELSAQGVAVFRADNDGVGAYVPSGTRVTADGDESTIHFETKDNIFATSAEISQVYQVSRKHGKTIRIYDREVLLADSVEASAEDAEVDIDQIPPFPFLSFQEPGIQKHILFLAADVVFQVDKVNDLDVCFKTLPESESFEAFADPTRFTWSILTEEGSIPFERISVYSERIRLTKPADLALVPIRFQGRESIWISVEAKDTNPLPLMVVDHIQVGSGSGELTPDTIYSIDGEVIASEFYPFGSPMEVGATCYIASSEVFSKKGAEVVLRFQLSYEQKKLERLLPEVETFYKYFMKGRVELKMPPSVDIFADEVVLEYYNGFGFSRIQTISRDVNLFNGVHKGNTEIRFRCPTNLEEMTEGATNGKFVRLRLVRSENLGREPAVMFVPKISDLALSYEYHELQNPDLVVLHDNTDRRNITELLANRRSTSLFTLPNEQGDSLYIGFTQKPKGAPVSIYFDIAPCIDNQGTPRLAYSYVSSSDGKALMKQLQVADFTDGFTHSGFFMFSPPMDFAPCYYFDHFAYYIKVADLYDDVHRAEGGRPEILGIYLNGVRIENKMQMHNERHSVESKLPGQSLSLSRQGVCDFSLFVNEQGELTEPEQQQLYALGLVQKTEEEIWVQWTPVSTLQNSGPNDRHYMLDEEGGIVSLGDDVHGKIPPAALGESIRIHFSYNDGKAAMLGQGKISTVADSLPGISSVSNPVPTYGGYEKEDVDEAATKALNRLYSMNRAVNESDFALLLKSCHRNVDQVRCLSGLNIFGEKGDKMTLAILMKDFAQGNHVFHAAHPDFLETFQQYAPITLSAHDVVLVQPLFVTVHTIVRISAELQHAYMAEEQIKKALKKFLHMCTGNFNGKGFRIGELPTEAKIRAFLRTLSLPCQIEKILVTGSYMRDGRRLEVELANSKMPFAACVSGRHSVVIN